MQIIGSRLKEDLPKIELKWLRWYSKIDFAIAMIFLILGKKGSGKSALVEALAMRYSKIIDLFSSRDDEGLAWCRESSPIDDILLVHGDNVDINASWDTCPTGKLTMSKMMDYEVVIPSYSFFIGSSGRFKGINKVIDLCWERRSWNKPIYVAVREASSFLYSRIKQEGGGFNMKAAKADFIYWQREMRHFGYSLGIDTIRWHSVDKEMRDLADCQIIKKVGSQGLPSDISFLYNYISPRSMAGLPPNRFMLIAENGSIALGKSECPTFHKEEGVDLLNELGITIEYGEQLVDETSNRIGDEGHVKIIALYSSGLPMGTIAKKLSRSKFTISSHVNKHNTAIETDGACPICTRARADNSDRAIPIRGR